MTDAYAAWQEANQRQLAAKLGLVKALLERHAARAQREAAQVQAEAQLLAADQQCEGLTRALDSSGTPAAISVLRALFDLSEFEQHTLLLCAGMELDASFALACANANDDAQRPLPTFGLALATLPGAHWSALAPSAPLRYWRLIEFVTGGLASAPLTTRPIRIDERILNYLTGVLHLDERLAGRLELQLPNAPLMATHAKQAQKVAAALTMSQVRRSGGERRIKAAIQLHGPYPASARGVAAEACAQLKLNLYAMPKTAIPGSIADLDAFLRLVEREMALMHCALLLEWDDDTLDVDHSSSNDIARELIDRIDCVLFVVSRQPLHTRHRILVPFMIGPAPANEQLAAWRAALGEAGSKLDGRVALLASQFNLDVDGMQTVVARSHLQAHLTNGESTEALFGALWDTSREQSRARLNELAQYIEPMASWDDLVLPKAQSEMLRDVVTHVRQRSKVYETWGFAAKSVRGLGISSMFAGPSGTGKTLAAEVLAHELQLDLFRIDLSAVVSKYIGETEKNLRRVFDAAEQGGAILLFDEADALFGKRSEVKDSHDRYANIEVSYLLQRMESYRGLAILTTNMRSALDTAFLRRIRFIVQFPFPNAEQRVEIWRRVFPCETPTEGLDFARLSRLNIAGGNIRNIALNAAFLAADANEPVRMPHLLHAVHAEYAKLERPLTDAEIAGW